MLRETFVVSLLAAMAATAVAGTTVPAQQSQSNNATYGHAPDGNVIFDQGPNTGTNGGCWSNQTESQNFSDFGPLPAGTSISGIVVYTCIPPTTGTVTFKAVDQSSHGWIYSESGAPADWVSDGNGGYIVTYNLANAFVVPSGTTMGYGLSGDGFELGQNSVLTPGDGFMSQYSGTSYAFEAGVGDQMYQLLGGSQCDVNGDGKYNAQDFVTVVRNCRHDGGKNKECLIELAKFAKQCGIPKR